MIFGHQIRAARGLLRWTIPRLSARTKVPEHMIADAEQSGDVPSLLLHQIMAIKEEMERAGIEFVHSAQPEVRLRLRLRETPEA